MTNKRYGSWPSYNGKKVLLDGEPGQVIYRIGQTATDLRLKVWSDTATSSVTGGINFTIPAGYFTAVHGVQATCLRNSTNATDGAFAMVRTVAVNSVVVQCFESKTTNTLLLSQAEGLELASSIQVMVFVYGLGA